MKISGGADLLRRKITADDGQRRRTVPLAEGAIPSAGWQAPIDHLRSSRRASR